MIEKIITPHDFKVPQVNIITPSEHFGIKCARENGVSACGRSASGCGSSCATKQANEDLKSFIRTLKPDPKYLFLHIIAMGAGEYFGPNTNGDYFPETGGPVVRKGLIEKHDTFRTVAKLFKHHINKDVNKSYGHVSFSTYNNPMHRVELVVAADREKAPDIVQRAENGERLGFSMSCRIIFDICSICGNKARTRSEYCTHIMNHLLEIQPDGKQVYMINEDPTFFDISYVLRPADKTAMLLSKVAQDVRNPKSDPRLDRGQNPKSTKSGDIKKEFETILEPALDERQRDGFCKYVMPLLKEAEPCLPIDVLKDFPINDILSTLTLCGIICKPHEYNRIIVSTKSPEDFKPGISHHNFNDSIYQAIKDVIPGRSFYNPYMNMRLIILGIKQDTQDPKKESAEYIIKTAPQKEQDHSARNKLLMLGALGGGAYAAYQTELGRKALSGIIEMIEKKPGKFLLIAGLGALALNTAPILGRQVVSDSFIKYHNGVPYGIEGVVVNAKQSSHIPDYVQAVAKRALDPFGMLYLQNSLVEN